MKWNKHYAARFCHILTGHNLDTSERVAQDLAPYTADGEPLTKAMLLQMFAQRDSPLERSDLDKKINKLAECWKLAAALFSHVGFEPEHVDPDDEIIANIDPCEWDIVSPQYLKKKVGDLRKSWDVAYETNYKKSGNMQPDFWGYCQGDAILYYLYKCHDMMGGTFGERFKAKLDDAHRYQQFTGRDREPSRSRGKAAHVNTALISVLEKQNESITSLLAKQSEGIVAVKEAAVFNEEAEKMRLARFLGLLDKLEDARSNHAKGKEMFLVIQIKKMATEMKLTKEEIEAIIA